MKCPACLLGLPPSDLATLAEHLHERARGSDSDHVRWLNQNLSRAQLERPELEDRLRAFFDLAGGNVAQWIEARFVARFFGPRPHPFVVALQHPSRSTLLGYVIEHQHFLRQWVRSCAYIMARTDSAEVVRYELDNLSTEFGGLVPGTVSHYELLLRMGESLGMDRDTILAFEPLPATQAGIRGWNAIASTAPWVEALAAMHSLELIAHRDLVRRGASLHYFDPTILEGGSIPEAAKAFLREGYEADVGHSEEALALVNSAARDPEAIQGVQAAFLRSIDLFDDYLRARLERGIRLEG
ncbi:MAG TPA: iron-containing redox enzyme family protein [Thermoplasmata archaeon]|nr:iron-containing redox enzyme family protein [Thermoplasmata archaeon]